MDKSHFSAHTDPSKWEPLTVHVPRIKSEADLQEFLTKYPRAFDPDVQVDLATEEGLLDSPSPPTNRSSGSTLIYPLAIALGLSFPLHSLACAILQRRGVPPRSA